MEQKEYLSEATYQKNKKKLTTLSLVILVIGLMFGGGLIAFGIVKTCEIKAENAAKLEQFEESKNYRTKAQIQADLDEAEEQFNVLELELAELRTQQQQVFIQDHGYSDAYYDLNKQINEKEQKYRSILKGINNYKMELWEVESGFNDYELGFQKTSNEIEESKYIPLFIIGGFVVMATLMIAGSVYAMAKRREILAFQTQQVMPVAQEGITKMAPTVGKAAGTIAKDVTSGIKKGWQEK